VLVTVDRTVKLVEAPRASEAPEQRTADAAGARARTCCCFCAPQLAALALQDYVRPPPTSQTPLPPPPNQFQVSDNDASSPDAPAPRAAPPPRDQAEQIEAAEQAPLAEGDKVYILSSAWWDGWRTHSGYEPPGGGANGGGSGAAAAQDAAAAAAADAPPAPGAPGRVDNRPLLENGGARALGPSGAASQLKQELEEGRDYVVVRAATWQLLSGWYGGGPEIERTAVLEGLAPNSKKPRINLYPMRLEVWCYNEKEPKFLEADAGVRSGFFLFGEMVLTCMAQLVGSNDGRLTDPAFPP
jgi:hypothetical protein